jgi:hypothetical protein
LEKKEDPKIEPRSDPLKIIGTVNPGFLQELANTSITILDHSVVGNVE